MTIGRPIRVLRLNNHRIPIVKPAVWHVLPQLRWNQPALYRRFSMCINSPVSQGHTGRGETKKQSDGFPIEGIPSSMHGPANEGEAPCHRPTVFFRAGFVVSPPPEAHESWKV